MKQWFFASVFVAAVIIPGCVIGGPCEYKTTETTARVSLTTVFPYEWDCTDPVEVKLAWGEGAGEWVLTTDAGENLPRACLDDIGLSDGAKVKILIEEETKGSCAPLIVSLVGVDMSSCEALCKTPPECPLSAPVPGQSCGADLSCYYGEPYVCPLDPGTTTFHECINRKWTLKEMPNCEVCGVSCEPPPCILCGHVLSEMPVPPDQITLCNDNSTMLYEAFWTCACVAGNPCAAVCNPEPAATSLCNGASPSPECADCLVNVAAPNGCMNETLACIDDF